VIAQYYQMIRLGYEGYKKVITNCVGNAKKLSDAISAIGKFKILSKSVGVPLVAFALLDDSEYDEHDIADNLKRYGWTLPAYTMAPDAQNVTLLRVVVREDFSTGLVERLVTDIKRVLKILETEPAKKQERAAQHAKAGQTKSRGQQRREEAKKAHQEDVSVFDKEHNKQGHFNVHKKHGLHKSNGVC